MILSNTPFFSIVIPTCDRPHLLQYTLKAALNVDYSSYEIIISDNFSSNNTYEVIKCLASNKIRYFRTDRRLNMADNWQFAYQQAKGDYILILGDDDGIIKSSLKKVEQIIKQTNAELITWMNRPYIHPDWPMKEKNHLRIGMTREIGLSLISTQHVLKLAAQLRHVTSGYFPHGSKFCFSKELGNRIDSKVGRVFDIPFPDFTSGLYMLAELQPKYYVYYTGIITFLSQSFQSNSAAYLLAYSKRNTQRMEQFTLEFSQPLYERTPLKSHNLWNGHAECVLKAIEKYHLSKEDISFDWVNYFWLCYQAIMNGWYSDPLKNKVSQLEEFWQVLSLQPYEVKDGFYKIKNYSNKKKIINYIKNLIVKLGKNLSVKVRVSRLLGNHAPYIDGEKYGFANLYELSQKLDDICEEMGLIDTFYYH